MDKRKKKYNPRKYNPALGDHAPSYLREAFHSFIELGQTEEIGLDSTLEDENHFTLCEIIGLLWNCTDTLPGDDYDDLLYNWDLELDKQTYAAAVRALKHSL